MLLKLQRNLNRMVVSFCATMVLFTGFFIILFNVVLNRVEVREDMGFLYEVQLRFLGTKDFNDDNNFSMSLENLAESALFVYVSSDGVLETSTNNEVLFSDQLVRFLMSKADARKRDFGLSRSYFFLKMEDNHGHGYMFLSAGAYLDKTFRLITVTVLASMIGLVGMLFGGFALVRSLVKPVNDSFDQQNQFIADASHELKTPVAVIRANADVIRSEDGDSKWLDYIYDETDRMSTLIQQMMFLTSIRSPIVSNSGAEHLDFSRLVTGNVLSFEAVSFERGQRIELDVDPGIMVNATSSNLEVLLRVLMSNAIKYGYDGALIKVSLKLVKKEAVLSVYNEGVGIAQEDIEKVFDRFYQVDKARTDQNSYGLGLAIARMIANASDATLRAESEAGKWARFTFVIKAAV